MMQMPDARARQTNLEDPADRHCTLPPPACPLPQCVAVDKYGCGDVANNQAACCDTAKCQRDAASDAGGTCKACIAADKVGCADGSDCCAGAGKCQKSTGVALTGTCKSCVANLQYGCTAASDCCTSGWRCTGGQCV